MEKYDNLGVIGEGSYGVVIKCKHKESGQVRSAFNVLLFNEGRGENLNLKNSKFAKNGSNNFFKSKEEN